MNKRLVWAVLCLAAVLSATGCTGKQVPSAPVGESSAMDLSIDSILDVDQLSAQAASSAPVEKELLRLEGEDVLLCRQEWEQGLRFLVRSASNELFLLSSEDGAAWERSPFAVEAEQAYREQYPDSFEILSAAAISPDGTYYTVRNTARQGDEEIQLLSLTPGAGAYQQIDTSSWFSRLEGDQFWAVALLAPTSDRLVLVYESDQSEKMTVGEYIQEYRDGDPGAFLADRDPDEEFQPVVNQLKKALLIDCSNMQVIKELDYSEDPRFDFGDGRWFANKTHLFYKDDNSDTFEFQAYFLETGGADLSLATHTDYSNHGMPGYRMFFASENNEIFWVNEEGVQRVALGGSLVEGIIQSEQFVDDSNWVEYFARSGDGTFIIGMFDRETEAVSIRVYR